MKKITRINDKITKCNRHDNNHNNENVSVSSCFIIVWKNGAIHSNNNWPNIGRKDWITSNSAGYQKSIQRGLNGSRLGRARCINLSYDNNRTSSDLLERECACRYAGSCNKTGLDCNSFFCRQCIKISIKSHCYLHDFIANAFVPIHIISCTTCNAVLWTITTRSAWYMTFNASWGCTGYSSESKAWFARFTINFIITLTTTSRTESTWSCLSQVVTSGTSSTLINVSVFTGSAIGSTIALVTVPCDEAVSKRTGCANCSDIAS